MRSSLAAAPSPTGAAQDRVDARVEAALRDAVSAATAAELSLVVPAATPAPPPELRVETVSDEGALRALEPIWNRLAEEAGIDHPFLAHEWIVTWWECFGAGKQLQVLVVKAGGEPVAIAPFMLSRTRLYGLPVRRLQLITNEHTQRADFIVAREHERAYAAIWDHLFRQRGLWDVLMLPQVPAGSPTMERLPRLAAADGHRWGAWRGANSPRILLDGTWVKYEGSLASKHRSNLRNRFKRLGALGAVELEVVTGGPLLAGAMEEGFALEGAAWKDEARTAIGCRPELRRFYGRLAEEAARLGWLQLQFLKVGGRRIAFGYALRFKNTLYLLKPGYDPAYSAYSPSNLLCSMVLRAAFTGGLAAYDLLGEDDPWKRKWTDEVRAHSWLFVFARGPRGRLLHQAKFHLLPWLRRVSEALRTRFAARGAARVSP